MTYRRPCQPQPVCDSMTFPSSATEHALLSAISTLQAQVPCAWTSRLLLSPHPSVLAHRTQGLHGLWWTLAKVALLFSLVQLGWHTHISLGNSRCTPGTISPSSDLCAGGCKTPSPVTS